MADGANRRNPVTSLFGHINTENIEDLVLGRKATIAEVEIMNDKRTDEFHNAASRLLAENGLTDAKTTHGIDWESISEELQIILHEDRENINILKQRINRTYPTLVEFTIDITDLDEPLEFKPGQFLDVRYNGTRRQYSIASSPNDDELTLCIRRVPGGKLTEDLLSNIQEGNEVRTYYARGNFTFDENSEKDLVFLATGTGVAPFRSMIRYLYQEDLEKNRDVWLFLGTRWKDDLPYHEEFKEFEHKHDGFHYVPTLSREAIVSCWSGETDYVQETFLKYLNEDIHVDSADSTRDTLTKNLIGCLNSHSSGMALQTYLDQEPRTDAPATIDPKNIQVYACGVDAAVSEFKKVTASIDVPRADVYSEGYG